MDNIDLDGDIREGKPRPKLRFYQRPSFQNYKAIVLVLFAAFALATSSALIKYLRYITAAELGFVRNSFVFVLNLPFLLYHGTSELWNKANLAALLSRGILGFASVYLLYMGMKLMPIADAAVINSTIPILVVILSRIVLKEHLDLMNSISVLLSVFGLVLISRVFSLIGSAPSEKYQDLNYWYGCLCIMGNALLLAVIYVLLRKLKGVDETVTLFYYSVIGTVGFTLVSLISGNVNLPICGWDGLCVVLVGVLSYFGQAWMTMALRMEKAGAVSSVRTSSQVAFTFLLQVALLDDTPDVYSILAAICVFAALWLSGMRKYCQQKRRRKIRKTEEAESVMGKETQL